MGKGASNPMGWRRRDKVLIALCAIISIAWIVTSVWSVAHKFAFNDTLTEETVRKYQLSGQVGPPPIHQPTELLVTVEEGYFGIFVTRFHMPFVNVGDYRTFRGLNEMEAEPFQYRPSFRVPFRPFTPFNKIWRFSFEPDVVCIDLIGMSFNHGPDNKDFDQWSVLLGAEHILAFSGTPLAWRYWRIRRNKKRFASGECIRCGYAQHGVTPCPECGTSAAGDA